MALPQMIQSVVPISSAKRAHVPASNVQTPSFRERIILQAANHVAYMASQIQHLSLSAKAATESSVRRVAAGG